MGFDYLVVFDLIKASRRFIESSKTSAAWIRLDGCQFDAFEMA
ncbi:unnamed protein product [Acidithrix sp. C25]|nr:unnamed protein product [Acidithrix sp. C25]